MGRGLSGTKARPGDRLNPGLLASVMMTAGVLQAIGPLVSPILAARTPSSKRHRVYNITYPWPRARLSLYLPTLLITYRARAGSGSLQGSPGGSANGIG